MIGMFGGGRQKLPWETPPISGAPNQQPWGTPPIAPTPEEQAGYGRAGGEITAEAPAPGFFAQGGVGRGIAGSIGDALLALNHQAPIYAPAMQQQRQQKRQDQQYQQHRQDEQSDWMAKQQWEIAHPKPANNDTINDFNFISQTLGKEAGEQYLRSIASGPPMAVDSIDPVTRDTVRQYIPRGQLPGMAPQGAAPGLPQGFTVRPKGGAGQQAPRTFR